MKKKLIIAAIVIVGLVVLRYAITFISQINRQKAIAASYIIKVQTQKVQNMEVEKNLEFPARIESSDKVDIVARIDGYLQKKHFNEGDFVKKGQVLFTIEPTQYLNTLNKARADLENAKASLYKAERDWSRGEELVKKDYISRSTYDGLYANKLSAQASVKAAQAALAEAQRNYSYTSIKSPVDGKTGSLRIQEGNYVSAASGTLVTVTKTNPVYVKYSVDSKQFDELKKLNYVSKNAKVELVLSNGAVYKNKGVQDFLDNNIALDTGTIDLRATFKNDDNALIPGDFVKVRVYSDKKIDALVIPQKYVIHDDKGKYVYVVSEDNTAQQKYFKDKGQYGDYWIIDSGLDKDEEYVITNMPNMKVELANEIPEKEGAKE